MTAVPDVLSATLSELADRIEELYVFPDAAREIARELRNRPIRTADPAELTAEVRRYLRGRDGHLSLVWLPGTVAGGPTSKDPDAPAADGGTGGAGPGPARPDVMDPEYQRRTNYGFRQAGLVADGVGLLELTLVADADLPEVVTAAGAATTMIAHTDAVVVDLRDVPGGWPSGGNLLAGHFLGPEPTHLLAMTRRGGEPDQQDWTPADNPLGHRPDVPLLVLVGERTASAGEAFAYTMQSLGRAVVIGQRTAGAANPGDFVPIGRDFKAFIPTMAPIDPRTGTNWEGTGVLPDVPTEPGDTWAAALDLAVAAARTRGAAHHG